MTLLHSGDLIIEFGNMMSFCSVPPLLSGQEGILSPNNNDDRNLWVLWGYKPNMGTISIFVLKSILLFMFLRMYDLFLTGHYLFDIAILSKDKPFPTFVLSCTITYFPWPGPPGG